MNWYGHKYLGPGNKLRNGKPVDEDDEIAEIHDHLYNKAKTQEDIREADRDAIKHFLDLNSAHGYLGAAGLAAKYGLESLTGVLYPRNMKRKPSAAQLKQRDKYAKVQRRLADLSRETGLSFREIQQAHSRDAWRDLASPAEAGPSNQHKEHGESDSKELRYIARPDTPPPEEQDELDENHFALFQDLEEMQIDMPPTQSNQNIQRNEATALAGNGPSGASGRSSGTTGVGHIVSIPRSLPPAPMTYTFRKTRIFFSYGIATKRINLNSDDYYTTPLALVPVDLAGFYLSPSEFREISNDAWAKECRVRITPLGIRTAFEFGGAITGHTTNEFVPIGMKAVGLNLNTEITNVTYKNYDDMLPNGFQDIKPTDIMDRYYINDDAHVNLVSRHAIGYACFVSPGKNQTTGAFKNICGQMRKDQHVDQFLINTAIGQPIVDYKYKFKHAPLSIPFYNGTNIQKDNMYRGGPQTRAFTLKIYKEDATLAHTEDRPDDLEQYTTTPKVNNIEFLEKAGHNMISGGWSYQAQPQVHVGIQAVPGMKPSNDNATFQNTSAYWAVEAELDVEIKHGSYYAQNMTCQFPKNVTLWTYNNTYNGWPTLSGLTPMSRGITAREKTPATSVSSADAIPPAPKKICPEPGTSSTFRRNLNSSFSKLELPIQSRQVGAAVEDVPQNKSTQCNM